MSGRRWRFYIRKEETGAEYGPFSFEDAVAKFPGVAAVVKSDDDWSSLNDYRVSIDETGDVVRFEWYPTSVGDDPTPYSWFDITQRTKEKAVSEKFRWSPKPDITAYELAVTLNVIVGALMRRPNWEIRGVFDNLPPEARRHFSINEKAPAVSDEGSKSSDDVTP